MSNEKRYTAKQAAEVVMAKVGELIKKFPGLKKYETENSKKLGYKPSKLGAEEKDAQPKSDAAYDVEKQKAAPERRVHEQIDPRVNPKENAEGNNAAPGARPYNTKKYGMEGQVRKSEAGMHKVEYHSTNLEKRITNENEKGVHPILPIYESGKGISHGRSVAGQKTRQVSSGRGTPEISGVKAKEEHKRVLGELKNQPKPNLPKSEEMAKAEDKKDRHGMSVRQHLVDKVHHSMKQHGYETHEASPNQVKEHAHNIGIKNLGSHEIVHAADTYRHEKELKKDATDAIQHGINTMSGGSTQSAQPSQGVASALSGAFGKSEELNKDFGSNFAQAATSGSITPAKIAQGAQSIANPSPTPAPVKKSEAPAGKSIGSAKLAKFMEDKADKRLKKS